MEHSPHGARIKPARARNIPNSRKSNPSNIISFPRNERTRLKRVSSKHKRQCVRGVLKLFRALREQRTFCYGSYRTWKRTMKYDHLRRMHCLESLLLSCCCSFLSVFALFFFATFCFLTFNKNYALVSFPFLLYVTSVYGQVGYSNCH